MKDLWHKLKNKIKQKIATPAGINKLETMPGRLSLSAKTLNLLPDAVTSLIMNWTPFTQRGPSAYFGHGVGAIVD